MARTRLSAVVAVFVLLASQAGFAAFPGNEKIPITTKSDEARKEYLEGRDLVDRLQIQKSLTHFKKAATLDPEFALAEFGVATSSPTQKEFVAHLAKAVQLAAKASPGEQLLIESTEALTKGKVDRSKECLEKLVTLFPNDERVQLAAGTFYFGQQNFDEAYAYFARSIELDPQLSTGYNLLGYTLRQLGRNGEAKNVFARYTTLIPDDPNPHDSYAELLMKMGEYQNSITAYRKALSIDPQFISSSVGVAMDLLYLNDVQGARSELTSLYGRARDDGERRFALYVLAVTYADNGEWDQAALQLEKEYAIAEKLKDFGSMSNDLLAEGNIRVAQGKYREALELFDRSKNSLESSQLTRGAKDNVLSFYRYSYLTAALGNHDTAAARKQVELAKKDADKNPNPALTRQSHQLAGILAFAEQDFGKAVDELEQADHQNPHNLYRLALAYEARGDLAAAQRYFRQVAEFNSLPQLEYAYVRRDAQRKLVRE